MSEGLNRCLFIGNLGADPELRVTGGGQAVLKMTVACTEKYQDNSGEKKERTEWVRCTIWGKRGEALAKILGKGDKVCVEGAMQTSSYEKDGEKRYSTEINVRNVVLLGGKRGGDTSDEDTQAPARSSSPRKPPGQRPAAASSEPASGAGEGDDDIPFAVPWDVAPNRHERRMRRWERF